MTRFPLLALLVIALAATTKVLAVSGPQEQAEFLAGLPVASGSPLAGLQKTPAYELHRDQVGKKWEYCRKARYEATRAWAAKQLGDKSARGVLRYLFGGPDFLGAFALFPNAGTIVLAGLEPVGSVAPPESLAPETLASSLAATRQAMSTALYAGYFVTSEMNEQLRQGNFTGVLPLLYAQLALTGNRIRSVEAVQPFGAPGVKIRFQRPMHSVQTLYYFQVNVANGSSCGRFFAWLGGLGEGASYLKSASYLLHGDAFSQARNFLLETSRLLVEDDSGLPFRYLDPSRWQVRLFGGYSPPIFSGYYQNDLRDAYAVANSGPLPFGVGYQTMAGKANILVARKTKRAAPKAPAIPVEESPVLVATAQPVTKAAARLDLKASPRPATVVLVDRTQEQSSAPDPGRRKSLVTLEAEELRIRGDASLTPQERTRQLHEIWKQQLAVMGKSEA